MANARELTNAFLELGFVFEKPIEPADLLFHWRVAYALFAIGAMLALVAGIGMFLIRRWSCLLLMAIALAALAMSMLGRLSGYTHYGFEGGSLRDSSILVVVALLMYLAYRKWPVAENDA